MTWFFDPLGIASYDVAMIDYPWPWSAWSEKGLEKSPEAHYETMALDAIAGLPTRDLFGRDGCAWFWCTWPLIDKQIDIIRHQGFTVKTGGVWSKRTASGKLRWGTGKIIRTVCEPFIIATVGRRVMKLGSAVANLIEAVDGGELAGLARENSRKPEEIYAVVESLTPGLRRADVFVRQSRLGWDGFGKEARKFDGVVG